MKLLFKHIRRSVLRSPKETLIIILTILISGILFSMIGEANNKIREEISLNSSQKYGNSDIAVSPDVSVNIRYMTNSVYSSVSDSVEYADGFLTVPSLSLGKTVRTAAADLHTIENIFPFSFISVEPVQEKDLNNAIYISSVYAKNNNISLGDEVDILILGKEKTFTVYGINRHRFFGNYDLLMNTDGAVATLSSLSAVFSVFDEDNIPYTSMFIKFKDGTDVNSALDNLNAELKTSGLSARISSHENPFFKFMMDIVLFSFVAFSLAIGCLLVCFSLNTLAGKRREEMESFRLAGMSDKSIFASLCIETFIYTVIGTSLGLLISYFLLPTAFSKTLTYTKPDLTIYGILVTAISEFAMWVLTLLIYRVISSKKKIKNKTSPFLVWSVLFAPAVIFAILTFTLPAKISYIFAIFAAFTLFLLLISSAKPLVLLISKVFSALSNRRKKEQSSTLFLAIKNSEKLSSVHNIYRSVSIIISTFAVVIVCLYYCINSVSVTLNIFNCDYSVLGVPESSYSDINATAMEKSSAYFAEGVVEGEQIIYIASAENGNFLCEDMEIYPDGNGIIIPEAVAKLYKKEIGDDISITLNDKPQTFNIQGFCKRDAFFAYINAKACGFQSNLLLIRSNEDPDALINISKDISFFGGMVEDIKDMTDGLNYSSTMVLSCLNVFIPLIGLLAFIGCANLIAVSFAQRKTHFASLRIAGISKKEIVSMIMFEIITAVLIILFLSAIGSLGFTLFIDSAFGSFGSKIL